MFLYIIGLVFFLFILFSFIILILYVFFFLEICLCLITFNSFFVLLQFFYLSNLKSKHKHILKFKNILKIYLNININ